MDPSRDSAVLFAVVASPWQFFFRSCGRGFRLWIQVDEEYKRLLKKQGGNPERMQEFLEYMRDQADQIDEEEESNGWSEQST